jgi:hypothetical protein
MNDRSATIAALNDHVRRTFTRGRIVFTHGVTCLDQETRAKVLTAFREFNAFNTDNDPHKERDFVSFEINGQQFFGKCSYYDLDYEFGSEDPSDPAITRRVWTIMLPEEY